MKRGPLTHAARFAPGALGVALVAAELVRIAARAVHLQWDFRVYLAAAHAARAGLDPWRVEDLVRVSGRPVALPFLYPPAALLPFLALSLLPEPAALALWIGLKVLLVAFLVVLWKRVFVPHAGWFEVALVAVFSSNAAALWDLRSGNVALIEAALVWGGLAGFVAGRRGGFAAAIVLAATFKLVPAAFLLLLLVPTRGARARPGLFFVALGALAAIVFGPALLGSGFPSAPTASAFPVAEANPTAFAFLVQRFGGVTPLTIAAGLGYLLALLLLSAGTLRALWRAGDARAWSIAAVTLYVLAQPRLMAYGWVLAGGALVALIHAAVPTRLARGGLVLLACGQGLLWAFQFSWDRTVAIYAPIECALLLWALATTSGILQNGEFVRPGAQPAA